MNALIEFLKYVAIGLVQGFTEPLPVSSSGHMIIVDAIFGQLLSPAAMNNFQIITNFASLLAIMLYYRKLISQLAVGSYKYVIHKDKNEKHNFNYILIVLLATIPTGIAGILIKLYQIEKYYTNILFVGICLFITGMLLLFIHHYAPTSKRETITPKDGLIMGFAQIIGLLPGISRSGITSSFAVANKVSLEKALRFSFMMYIPASIGAAMIGFYDVIKSNEIASEGLVLSYIGAFFAAFIGTFIAINLFFKLVRNRNLKYFGYYCLSVSVIVLFLILIGVFKW